MTTQSFEEFYRTQFAGAARLAYLLLGTQLASDDLVQDSFLAIEPRYESLTSPTAYLRATIVNGANSWHRTRLRRERIATTLYRDGVVSAREAELFDVLASLPFQQRAALTLRYWCDLSNADIANLLDCRVGTVKSTISRGLARLRDELGEVM